MNKKFFMRMMLISLLGAVATMLNSCLPLAAGAAAGYVAHDQGYRVQSPVRQVE